MSNKEAKIQLRDAVEHGIDKLHKIADVVTAPVAPLDGAVHGFCRGFANRLTDTHPEDTTNKKPCESPCNKGPQQPQPFRGGGGRGGGQPAVDISGNQARFQGSNIAGEQEVKGNKYAFGNN